MVSQQDRHTLRELGQQIADIAALPQQQETITDWKALNGLQPGRPMVMIDQDTREKLRALGYVE